ncbi:yqaJ domain-containing protein [Nephila pilipes]|uniref:YqaJ domain-containing protein n=1 Tax=Nephila pilipes TaxID=299642 RepID=A0A8X6ITP4_NEPPI|nr:yqaJ domain-containing protein [Nephila pilipes]
MKLEELSCSNTLIWNATNNPAETYMSQLCKVSGGKRINFSKAGGFNRRANIAVLSFQNPAQQYHGKAYKMIANKSPRTPLNKFLLTRRNKYLKRLQRRKLFPNIKKFQPKQYTGDCNYGDSVEKPDMPTEIFESMAENLLSKLKVQNNSDVEFETKGQTTSERWRYERSLRLSSSFFKEVACRKASTPCSKLVKRIVYGTEFCTAAMKYGLVNEEIARKQYERKHSVTVRTCGLFVDKDNPFLCASPDGLIGNDGLLEIKCPYSAIYESNLLEFLATKKNSLNFKISNERAVYLPLNHRFYHSDTRSIIYYAAKMV